MGNQGLNRCLNYHQTQINQDFKRQIKIVSNAPSTKYAVRLKNQFPDLPSQIQSVKNKNQNIDLTEIIQQTPIYFIYQQSAVYQGHWKKGLPHGYGRIIYQDFSYYQGLVLEGKPDTGPNKEEEGLYIYKDGSYYVGNFKNAVFQGRGKLITKNSQMKMIGNFSQGLPNGRGVQTFLATNQVYQGEFVNGLKQGYGKYYVDQRLVYQGQFYRGAMHGDGRLIDYDGTIFIGRFQNGSKKHGQLRSIAGNFMGDLGDGQKKGQGFYQWQDGKFYVGQFKNKKFNGKGMVYFPNGKVVQGIWKKGKNDKITKTRLISQEQVTKIKQNYVHLLSKKDIVFDTERQITQKHVEYEYGSSKESQKSQQDKLRQIRQNDQIRQKQQKSHKSYISSSGKRHNRKKLQNFQGQY